jgi:hypothetical protein
MGYSCADKERKTMLSYYKKEADEISSYLGHDISPLEVAGPGLSPLPARTRSREFHTCCIMAAQHNETTTQADDIQS